MTPPAPHSRAFYGSLLDLNDPHLCIHRLLTDSPVTATTGRIVWRTLSDFRNGAVHLQGTTTKLLPLTNPVSPGLDWDSAVILVHLVQERGLQGFLQVVFLHV